MKSVKRIVLVLIAIILALVICAIVGFDQKKAENQFCTDNMNTTDDPKSENVAIADNTLPEQVETDITKSSGNSIAELKQTHSPKSVPSVANIEAYSDHWYEDSNDITADLSDSLGLTYSLSVSDVTSFSFKPAAYNKDELIEWGKDPGLGISILHKLGYDGTGAVVAYVDQPIAQPFHKEYDNAKLHYINTVNDGDGDNSMHGPAVLSLLAGEECGTAPGAEVYYYAHASWKADQTTHANCLYQIIEMNKTLPETDRIKMVAFSDNIDDSEANAGALRAAVKACEDAGIMVWFCGEYGSGVFLPLSDKADPENLVKASWANYSPELVYVPAGSRTTAATMSGADYIYWSDGGLSWTMPYMLGVYSIAISIDDSLTQSDIRSLIVSTAYTNSSGISMVDPVEFIAAVLERVNKSTEADTLRTAYADSRNYIYAIMDTAQLSGSDLSSIADYLSNLNSASVVIVDAAEYSNAASIYDALKNDHLNRGGNISGIQIFGNIDMVPAFLVNYKVQMVTGVDEGDYFPTDVFYGNLNNSSDTISASYNVCDHFTDGLSIDLIPDWPVVRLPLGKDDFTDYFARYNDFAGDTGLTKQRLVNFSNPIFASADHIDDMGTFLNRMHSEFGTIDPDYSLYGNLRGQYPVTTTVQGGFTAADLSSVNDSGAAEFLINSHGQRNNIDCCYYTNGEEQRESLINNTTINTVLGSNPYFLDCWTCNNAFGLKDNLITTALTGKCIGAFAATTIVSNNGVNCNASLSELKQSNFYYFYYTYLKELNEGRSRSQAFYAAQKEYGEAVMTDSKQGIRENGNYQFNLYNLIGYENFGVIEPNVAVMALYKNNGYISQAGQSVPKDKDNSRGDGDGYAKSDLTPGSPIGASWTVPYSMGTDCSSPENYTFYGLSAQQLDNGYVRITLDYEAPEGMYVDAFDPPNGDRFTLFGDVSTGSRQSFTFDVSFRDLSDISKFTVKFFGGGKQASEFQYAFINSSSILSGFDTSILPKTNPVSYSLNDQLSSSSVNVQSCEYEKLPSGAYLFTIALTATKGMKTCLFDPPDGDRFIIFFDETTGAPQSYTFDLETEELKGLTNICFNVFSSNDDRCIIVMKTTDLK